MTLSMHLASIDVKAIQGGSLLFILGMERINGNFHILWIKTVKKLLKGQLINSDKPLKHDP